MFLGIISLCLSGCGFTPPAGTNRAVDLPVVAKPSAVTTKLDLSHKQLKSVPEDVFKQTKLAELDISDNQLTGAIRSQIGQLANLRVLDASNNQMTGVPAEIGQLANLEILNLSNNQLTGLPYELGNLKKLKILNLSGNAYSEADLEVIKKGLPANVEIIK